MSAIKVGDTVFHRPSGETWTVAHVDPERDELMPCGWPEGFARLSDCELRESCTEEERIDLLWQLARTKPSWERQASRRRQYARNELFPQTVKMEQHSAGWRMADAFLDWWLLACNGRSSGAKREAILADYFEIDLDALEKERRFMIDRERDAETKG